MTGGGVGVGKVERLENVIQIAPVDVAVDCASVIRTVTGELDGAPAHGGVDASAYAQQAIAEGLKSQAPPGHFEQVHVVRILAAIFRIIVTSLLVGIGGKYEPMQLFHRPFRPSLVTHEIHRQPVKQWLIGGFIGAQAEFTGCTHDASTKMI